MELKSFKTRRRGIYIVGYVSCLLMILIAIYILVDTYPEPVIAGPVFIILISFFCLILFFAVQHMTIQISDSEMISKVLFFKSTIRFKDVKECYVVNNRILSFYTYDGKEHKYALYAYEDPDGICTELRKHIKVISNI